MSKDPAFLFYSSDFLTGTAFMTDEQVGKYVRLLCYQHQRGRLKKEHVLKICNSDDNEIFEKFKIDENGNYYNERLEDESNKRKSYSESRKRNRQKKDTELISETYVLHMENENENINRDINKDTFIPESEKKLIKDIFYDERIQSFQNIFQKIVKKPCSMNQEERAKLAEVLNDFIVSGENLETVTNQVLQTLNKIEFSADNPIKPSINWLLKGNNFNRVYNGEFKTKNEVTENKTSGSILDYAR